MFFLQLIRTGQRKISQELPVIAEETGPEVESNDEPWIRDESPPPLVPSDLYLPVEQGGMFDRDLDMIEDTTPPPLVPSELYLPTEGQEGMDPWETANMEDIYGTYFRNFRLESELREVKKENLKLKKENQFFRRCCFEILLFAVGDVAQALISSI